LYLARHPGKTRPNLREFEKYAVRLEGDRTIEWPLDDALMLKDTHLKAVGNLESFIREIRGKIPFTSKIEVECPRAWIWWRRLPSWS